MARQRLGISRSEETAVLVPCATELDERLERIEAKLSGPLVVLPGLIPIRDEPWASSVQLASDEGSFLYADDVVLRQRAASVGIRSFGTVALIQAALAQGQIDELFADAAIRLLLAEYVVDLPLSAADIISQAERDDWQLLAGAAPSSGRRFGSRAVLSQLGVPLRRGQLSG